jgi:ribosomal protein S8
MKSKKELAIELYNSLAGIKENTKGELLYFPHTKIKEILLKVVKDKELIKEINLL